MDAGNVRKRTGVGSCAIYSLPQSWEGSRFESNRQPAFASAWFSDLIPGSQGSRYLQKSVLSMYLLGHLGIGLGLAWLLSTRTRQPVDYRPALPRAPRRPVLVATPLGSLPGLEARLWAHTLLFLGIIVAVSAIPRVRGLVYLGFGIATHLLLDLIWEQPWIALWPVLGAGFPPGTMEVIGLVAFVWPNPAGLV